MCLTTEDGAEEHATRSIARTSATATLPTAALEAVAAAGGFQRVVEAAKGAADDYNDHRDINIARLEAALAPFTAEEDSGDA